MQDTLFTTPHDTFQFNQDVANVFDNMLIRSVPHYTEIQTEIAWWTSQYIHPNSTVYDLGCSTGHTYTHLKPYLDSKNTTYIGIDYSTPMLQKALDQFPETSTRKWHQHDLNHPYPFAPPSVIILNLVLQFISPQNKLSLLKNCHTALTQNSALILIEKTIPSAPELQKKFTARYHQFKEQNGYTKTEIKNKQTALKGVLTPQSIQDHTQQLISAGFSATDTFFQWYPFTGLIALK